MSDTTHARAEGGFGEDNEVSLRSIPVDDGAASGSQGLVEVLVSETQQRLGPVADDGAGKAGPASEPSAPATLQDAARALMNV